MRALARLVSDLREVELGWTLIGGLAVSDRAVDLATGTQIWRRYLGGVLRGLGQHDGTIYIGSLSGKLIAYEPEALLALQP